MTRRLPAYVLAVVATSASGCGAEPEPEPEAAGRTAVVVRFDPDGAGPEPARTRELRCPSAGADQACRALARVPRRVFAPVPPDAICTRIYGGPQVGSIRGIVDGRRVDARFRRTGGCEDARYRAVERVLQAA